MVFFCTCSKTLELCSPGFRISGITRVGDWGSHSGNHNRGRKKTGYSHTIMSVVYWQLEVAIAVVYGSCLSFQPLHYASVQNILGAI